MAFQCGHGSLQSEPAPLDCLLHLGLAAYHGDSIHDRWYSGIRDLAKDSKTRRQNMTERLGALGIPIGIMWSA